MTEDIGTDGASSEVPDARPGPAQPDGGASPDVAPDTRPGTGGETGPDAGPDAAARPDALAQPPGTDAGPDTSSAEGGVTTEAGTPSEGGGVPLCPALPPGTVSLVWNCAPGLCSPNGWNGLPCDAGCGVSLYSGPALDVGEARGQAWLLPPAPSCSGSEWTGSLRFNTIGQSGCVKVITSTGRHLSQSTTNVGACVVSTFLAQAGTTEVAVTVHAPVGSPLGWTAFESSPIVAGSCPLSCP